MAVVVLVRLLAVVLQQVAVTMQPVWMLLLGLVPVAALLRVLLVSVLVLLSSRSNRRCRDLSKNNGQIPNFWRLNIRRHYTCHTWVAHEL